MLDILLVDDEPSIRLSVGDALRAAGHSVRLASDGAEAISLAGERVYDVVVSDVRLPKADGLAVFKKVREQSPTTDVILITAFGRVPDAVQALKDGAYDYLTKPFDPDELVLRLGHIAERRTLQNELAAARVRAGVIHSSGIIGRAPVMVRLLERIETVAGSDAPVLITGESGTGKELVARSLHQLSPRRDKAFVAVNCAAFPETLLEAELFGHERGAFTGAVKKRDGRFKAADGGTLLLDEISEIPLPAQAKLLRVLQEGIVEPLGTNAAVPVDVRILSASNRNLKQLVVEGRFREDLYYRLNVLDISLPPLRERRSDVPLLVEAFLERFRKPGGSPTVSPRAWAALAEYPFPGNVRELEHAIQRAVVLAQGKEIDLDHLPPDIVGKSKPAPTAEAEPGSLRPLAIAAKEFEREYLLRALGLAEGRKARAAEFLGISRKNLWEKLRAHGLSDADLEEPPGDH
jgi:DNA-binding NtrC family response regulator